MIDNNKDKMNTGISDKKALLSSLWIFLSVNYIFCDVLSGMEAGVLKEYLTGQIGGIQLTQVFLLMAGISMEIPFTMIVLTRVLKYRVNRWTNIIAGTVMAIYQLSTMFIGTTPSLQYLFFSTIEIFSNLLIVWLAWRWADE